MARLEKREVQVEVLHEYVLTLSHEEAEVIQMVLGRVSGAGEIRSIVSDVYNLLARQGVATWNTAHKHLDGELTTIE